MNKKKLWIGMIVLIIAALAILLFIPRDNHPSRNSRVVLEHTQRAYIAPSCFESADATNFIEDGTLQKAEELNYPPINDCTSKAFESNNDSFMIDFLKELGILEKESTDW